MSARLPATLLIAATAFVMMLAACDGSGLPSAVPPPVGPVPTLTAAAVPTLTEGPPTNTAVVQDTPASTPTAEATVTVEPTPNLETGPTGTSGISGSPPSETATRRPRPTSTVTVEGTTTGVTLPPPTVTQAATEESVPSGGWSEVVRVAPGKHRIALTFDAGASGEPMPRILAALRDHGVHITMFITGKFAEQYPDAIRQAAAEGHEIANHTYSHRDSRTLTDAQLTEEFARTETILSTLTGKTTKPYWRPPLGARNTHVLNVAVSQGYRSIYWTLDSLDSVGQTKTAAFIFNRVTNTPGVDLDGAIILQHIGSEPSAEALPRELDRLQEMGLQVVTISELISP